MFCFRSAFRDEFIHNAHAGRHKLAKIVLCLFDDFGIAAEQQGVTVRFDDERISRLQVQLLAGRAGMTIRPSSPSRV